MFSSREVNLSFWIDLDSAQVSTWCVGAWQADGQPVALRVQSLPFSLYVEEALPEALRYLAELATSTSPAKTLPHPPHRPTPWHQLEMPWV